MCVSMHTCGCVYVHESCLYFTFDIVHKLPGVHKSFIFLHLTLFLFLTPVSLCYKQKFPMFLPLPFFFFLLSRLWDFELRDSAGLGLGWLTCDSELTAQIMTGCVSLRFKSTFLPDEIPAWRGSGHSPAPNQEDICNWSLLGRKKSVLSNVGYIHHTPG